MASNVTSRAVTRKALAALLETALGTSVHEVFNYRVTDLGNRPNGKPVETAVVVTSGPVGGGGGGSDRTCDTNSTRAMTEFYFNIILFVFSDFGNEDTAEDTLDALEKAVADVLIDNATYTGYWALLEIADRSTVDEIPMVSATYKRETIPVRVELYDD